MKTVARKKRKPALFFARADREWLISALQVAIGVERHDTLASQNKLYRIANQGGRVNFDTWDDLLKFAQTVGGIPSVTFAVARIEAWKALLDRLAGDDRALESHA